MTADPAAATYAFTGAFVEELVGAGMRHVCIAPGSRSTPLALAIAKHGGLRIWMHLDERCAAFFALGMARTLNEPVAVLCTSGTAAANFLPAVVEARAAAVPLLVLTADRPPELRDVGSAQTIDQARLFGSHAKWFVDVALPEATPDLLRYVRTLASRAVALCAAAPAGPVHLNFPFREPLIPRALATDAGDDIVVRSDRAQWVRVTDAPAALDRATVERLSQALLAAGRPVIVCGPQPDPDVARALGSLASRIGAPLLADPLSQLRWGSHERGAVIDHYDAILRHEHAVAELAPDFVLRVGGVPTSKPLNQYLERHSSAPLTVIDESRWTEPSLLASEMIHANPGMACAQLLEAVKPATARDRSWLDRWSAFNGAAGNALERFTSSLSEPFEGRALADVVSVMPDHSTLFVSSSMPVRDLDAFGGGDARDIRVLANRGANGIDGVTSTALGAAAALRETQDGPLALVTGDMAFYHDMNGLLAAKLHGLDATIVILNNDGGGIFSFLPQASHPEHFEQLFGTPHGLDFEPAASLYGAVYTRAIDSSSLRRAVAAGLAGSGLHIIELRTERERNVAVHREAWAAVAAALDAT